MLKKKTVKEAVVTGGGATGVSSVPDPVETGNTKRPPDQGGSEPMQTIANVTPQTDLANVATNQASIATKPSAASAAQESADLLAAFDGVELTEEFKGKVTTLFEAAVSLRVASERTKLQEEFDAKLVTEMENLEEETTAKLDAYVSEGVSKFLEENKLAIETGIRTEIAESFMAGLQKLFVEHNIDIPDDKLDAVSALEEEIEELRSKLNETITESIELKTQINGSVKDKVFAEVAEGMAVTQIDKLKGLSESVEFTDVEGYRKKLTTIKENFFRTKKNESGFLVEDVSAETPTDVVVEGAMASYVAALKKTSKTQ